MHKVNFKKSWSDLGNNIVLFLPDLVNIIFILIFGYIILNIAGLYDFLRDAPYTLGPQDLNDALAFISSNMSTILISIVVLLIGAFFFSIAVAAVKFGMIKDVVNKKRANVSSGMSYIKKYYGGILNIKLWTFLIYMVVLIVAILINIILRAIGLDLAALIVSLILLVILAIKAFLSLMFRYPIMFTKNKNAKESIKLSYKFFKENKGYNLVIFGIIIAVAVVISVIFSILGNIPYVGEFIQTLSPIGTLVASVWANVFLFNSYLKK